MNCETGFLFKFLYIADQFSQHNLLKRFFLLYIMHLAPLFQINSARMSEELSFYFSFLFHCFGILPLPVSVPQSFKVYSLKSGNTMRPIFFFQNCYAEFYGSIPMLAVFVPWPWRISVSHWIFWEETTRIAFRKETFVKDAGNEERQEDWQLCKDKRKRYRNK